MVNYKLIKKYPGSPDVGKVANLNKDGTKYLYAVNREFFSEVPKNHVENNPEFWEKISEKNYEIIDIEYNPGNRHAGSPELNSKSFKITSIKRLSDGVIFKIGDCVISKTGNYTIIKEFVENDNYSFGIGIKSKHNVFGGHDDCCISYVDLVKKEILFTTYDGTDKYEGDKYYTVFFKGTSNVLFKVFGSYIATDTLDNYSNDCKYFSFRKNAEEFIKKYELKYSEKDMIDFATDVLQYYPNEGILGMFNNWKKKCRNNYF